MPATTLHGRLLCASGCTYAITAIGERNSLIRLFDMPANGP
jgi:hypothetical protein